MPTCSPACPSGNRRAEPVGSVNLDQQAGNHLVIAIGDGTYDVLAYLKQDSLLVAVGDTVRTGQPVALVGNSGTPTSRTCTCRPRTDRRST